MKMRTKILCAAIVFTLIPFSTFALSCTEQDLSPQALYKDRDAVFIGEVSDLKDVEIDEDWKTQYTVEVLESWKGLSSKKVEVLEERGWDSWAANISEPLEKKSLSEGSRYLFFLDEKEKGYRFAYGWCEGGFNFELEEAEDYLAFLEEKEIIYPGASENDNLLLIFIIGILLAAGGGLAWCAFSKKSF